MITCSIAQHHHTNNNQSLNISTLKLINKSTIKRYRDRPEVREWQEQQRQMAKRQGYVRTIMGRRRLLHDANVRGPLQGRALRAAINTPVQVSLSLCLGLRAYFSILVVSCFIWSATLESSGILQSYSIVPRV